MDTSHAILMFGTFIISTTFHEASHAFLAWKGGDPTAYRGGQVSLNPLPHIRREPIGMVILPALMLYASNGEMLFGFASAPIDPLWVARHPGRSALVSAGGPLANLLLAVIAFIVLSAIGISDPEVRGPVEKMAIVFLFMNVLLFIFNLFPVPPLDGAGVVEGLVPASRGIYSGLRSNPTAAIFGILAVSWAMRYVFPPVWSTVRSWLPPA